jgi:hypothetical protein
MDNVTIGGITLHNQAVECADKVSPQFEQSSTDGLLGLAFVSSAFAASNNGQC